MPKPPWLFWTVALVAVPWNAFNLYDYWMTSTGDAAYLREYDPTFIAWILAFPFWREAMWATSVGAGLFGALAFLARRRVAVVLFLVSFVLMVIGFAGHDILLADGARKYGVVGLVESAIRMLAAFGLWRYAERAARLGYLA